MENILKNLKQSEKQKQLEWKKTYTLSFCQKYLTQVECFLYKNLFCCKAELASVSVGFGSKELPHEKCSE